MTDMITDHVKLAGGVTAVLERPGTRPVYEEAGDGPAVVLIHGFGLDMRMWDPQIGPLAARCRVVRYDCRGFGASGPLDPAVPYTHAGDLVALLDHLDIGRAVLAGLSFGGRVALQAAPADPGRVCGLALLDAVLDGVPWDPESARALDEVARRVQAGGVRAGREAWLAHPLRSEEHTLNSSHRCISYAVFCLKKKINDDPAKAKPTCHDLRRTCGTLLLRRSAKIVYVGQFLARASPEVTRTEYAKLLYAMETAA